MTASFGMVHVELDGPKARRGVHSGTYAGRLCAKCHHPKSKHRAVGCLTKNCDCPDFVWGIGGV